MKQPYVAPVKKEYHTLYLSLGYVCKVLLTLKKTLKKQSSIPCLMLGQNDGTPMKLKSRVNANGKHRAILGLLVLSQEQPPRHCHSPPVEVRR